MLVEFRKYVENRIKPDCLRNDDAFPSFIFNQFALEKNHLSELVDMTRNVLYLWYMIIKLFCRIFSNPLVQNLSQL